MSALLTRQAFEAYRRGDFTKALDIYRELARQLGEKNFSVNIELTERRIQSLSSGAISQSKEEDREQNPAFTAPSMISTGLPSLRTNAQTISVNVLPKTITLPGGSTDRRLVLTEVPISCQINLSEDDYALVSADVSYEHIPPGNGRKAIAIVEYFDAVGALVPGSYPGLVRSDNVGWFCYLAPSNSGDATFALQPPPGTALARIGFRSIFTTAPQRVTIAPKLTLCWHDNSPGDREGAIGTADSGLPTLPVLPFEMPTPAVVRRLVVASVLDPFSHACFAPECELIPITPARWRDELIGRHVDLVLVESAWHGNNDAWQYRVAKYASPPGNELAEVLRWARLVGVPTVFWNKEDPPNFDRFIDRAAEFDYIFTTDENCIQRYRNRVPASTHVGVLPFAAQPRIHNPLLEKPRLDATSFAGTYYADDFEPRRRAMDMLLRVAARHGLDIFDRMHSVTGKDKERFAFPIDLQPYIRGSLDYDEMLKAYRRYRVGLNVNSVSDSPTMFSRRVYELLACGTPVVSTESSGIDRMFDGLVPTVESEVEAVETLKALMEDPMHWLKTSVRGLRKVFKSHTYGHRLQTVAATIGINAPHQVGRAPVVVVIPAGDSTCFASLMKNQDVLPAAVIVVGARFKDNNSRLHVNALLDAGIDATALPAANIATYVRHRYSDSVVAVCDSRNHYGPAYLLDALIALEGTPEFGASTMLSADDPVQQANWRGFDAVACMGMPCAQMFPATLVARPDNSLLSDALMLWSKLETVEIGEPLLRTRASFDFISHNTLAAGFEAGRTDLR